MTLDEIEEFARANVLVFTNRDSFIDAVRIKAKPTDETDRMMVDRIARYIWDSTPRPPNAQ